MRNNNTKIEEMRRQFLKQLQREYEAFKISLMQQHIHTIYEESLKITFYREIYRYLTVTGLCNDEYTYFADGNTIEKLWELYYTNILKKQNGDFLRQLIKLHIENQIKGAQK